VAAVLTSEGCFSETCPSSQQQQPSLPNFNFGTAQFAAAYKA
jgi:hypothetical protein